MNALTTEAAELAVRNSVQLASTHAKALTDSKEYVMQKFAAPYLATLKRKMLTAVADINKWKNIYFPVSPTQFLW